MNLSQLRDEIKTEAIRLGFNHIGISPAFPVPHFQAYVNWIDASHQADMTYLARQDAVDKRSDPRLILESCQSVICLAVQYQQPQMKLEETDPGNGRISSYARTNDYHAKINELLSQLEAFICARAGVPVQLRSYVDTGPILERAYANRAGIGAIGKNGCLIIPQEGSFFFLAEILTTLALPADQPTNFDVCKNCQRCIQACPTGCIKSNRTIDANHCISYLTIENRGTIPDELKDEIGNWLFGCDICQMVCPHNARPADQSTSMGDQLLPESIELTKLYSLDDESFKAEYGHTPLSRAKRRGILRNASVVLGNQKFQPALPTLEKALSQEEDPVIQEACSWAINKIKSSSGSGKMKYQSHV